MASTTRGSFQLLTPGPFTAGGSGSLQFAYSAPADRAAGTKVWLIYEIRQDAGKPQAEDPDEPNYVSASIDGRSVVCEGYHARTLELYPVVPEFLHFVEVTMTEGLPAGEQLEIQLGTESGLWTYSKTPIESFSFWLVEGGTPDRTFEPTGFRGYREYDPVIDIGNPDDLPLQVSIPFGGAYRPFTPENTRKTPGILWGEIHGMVFNQRPLDDYYSYARDVANYDFAAPMLFSYNVCVGDVWEGVKDAAERFTVPGEFVGIAGIEFGTPPDDSHRNAHFFCHDDVPPIFFEGRPPALDPRYMARLHPDTIVCRDMDHFYDTVAEQDGIVTAHFHTKTVHREILTELWQKQVGSQAEEARTFDLLNRGKRMGIVCGSDTHDSMPGNPDPEPGCPQAAGFMAVLSDELTPDAIKRAILERRVYGTTGARIALRVDSSGHLMGGILSTRAPREFIVSIEGTTDITSVELIHNGEVVDAQEPKGRVWEGELNEVTRLGHSPGWYVVRVTQQDGHRAWSSPFWFE